jgi:hypothetical protein
MIRFSLCFLSVSLISSFASPQVRCSPIVVSSRGCRSDHLLWLNQKVCCSPIVVSSRGRRSDHLLWLHQKVRNEWSDSHFVFSQSHSSLHLCRHRFAALLLSLAHVVLGLTTFFGYTKRFSALLSSVAHVVVGLNTFFGYTKSSCVHYISVSHLHQLCTEQVSKASDWMPWEQLHWQTEHLQLTTQVTQQQQLHSAIIILPEL